VLEPTQPNRRRIEWKIAATTLSPVDRDYLRLISAVACCGTSSPSGCQAWENAEIVWRRRSAGGLNRDKSGWVLHSGGRKIQAALSKATRSTRHDLRWSAAVLRVTGVSSPCVLFIAAGRPDEGAPGGFWWMSSLARLHVSRSCRVDKAGSRIWMRTNCHRWRGSPTADAWSEWLIT
jgi:hypothetical protein